MDFLDRSRRLFGSDAIDKMQGAHVFIFGLGGVGSWAAEALVRSGLGAITLVDKDLIELTNLNRQLPALHSSLGSSKSRVLGERLQDINPELKLKTYDAIYQEGDGPFFLADLDQPASFVLDCVDDVKAKADLIYYCAHEAIPIISAGGCARRIDPSKLQLKDIYKTSGDPLLKPLRKILKNMGLKDLPVISSTEQTSGSNKKGGIASAIFVPAVCGIEMARYVSLDLMGLESLSRARLNS